MSKFTLPFALAALAFINSTSFAQSGQRAPSPTVFGARVQTAGPRLFTETSIEKAWASASKQQQPLLVMFTSDNCRFCKKMLAETYSHPAIEQMLAGNTQTVLAHSKDYKSLVKRLGIRGYPSSVLLSPKGDVLDFMEGFVPPKDFAKRVTPILRAQLAQRQQQPVGATQARAAQLPVHATAGR